MPAGTQEAHVVDEPPYGPPDRPYGQPLQPYRPPAGQPVLPPRHRHRAARRGAGRRGVGRGVVLGLVGLLVLGGLGYGAWVLFVRDPDPATDPGAGPAVDARDPRAVAERFVAMLQLAEDEGELAVTPAALEPLVCRADMPEIEQFYADAGTGDPEPPAREFDYSVGTVRTDGDTGTVTFERVGRSSGESETQNATLVVEDGGWQVCGLSAASGGESPPTR